MAYGYSCPERRDRWIFVFTPSKLLLRRLGHVLRMDASVGFPCLGVLPADVAGVVEMKEQTLPSVEKAEAEEVVFHECQCRIDDAHGQKSSQAAITAILAQYEW